MTHKHGTHLDGIATLEDLQGRCVVSDDCWHIRTARGREYPEGQTIAVWSHHHGQKISARRLGYILAHPGKPMPRTWVVYSNCGSHDCVNPEHLKAMGRGAYLQMLGRKGLMSTARKTAANRVYGAARSKHPPEVWRWALESTQTHGEVAHALGVATSNVANRRARQRASVGIFGAQA